MLGIGFATEHILQGICFHQVGKLQMNISQSLFHKFMIF